MGIKFVISAGGCLKALTRYSAFWYLIAALALGALVDGRKALGKHLNTVDSWRLPILYSQLKPSLPVTSEALRQSLRYYTLLASFLKEPGNALGMTALCHYALGDMASAKAYYGKAVRERPDYFYFWYDLGLVHLRQKEYAEAAVCFEKALFGNFGQGLKALVLSALETKSVAEREGYFSMLKTFASRTRRDSAIGLILSYYHLQEYEKMETAARLAAEGDLIEDMDVLHFYIGVALYLQGRHQEAFELFQKNIKENPGWKGNYYYLVLCVQEAGLAAPPWLRVQQAQILEYFKQRGPENQFFSGESLRPAVHPWGYLIPVGKEYLI